MIQQSRYHGLHDIANGSWTAAIRVCLIGGLGCVKTPGMYLNGVLERLGRVVASLTAGMDGRDFHRGLLWEG